MTVTQRFSRGVLLAEIDRRLKNLYEWHGFTKSTGLTQVENGSDTQRVLAYGEILALESLRERFTEGV